MYLRVRRALCSWTWCQPRTWCPPRCGSHLLRKTGRGARPPRWLLAPPLRRLCSGCAEGRGSDATSGWALQRYPRQTFLCLDARGWQVAFRCLLCGRGRSHSHSRSHSDSRSHSHSHSYSHSHCHCHSHFPSQSSSLSLIVSHSKCDPFKIWEDMLMSESNTHCNPGPQNSSYM